MKRIIALIIVLTCICSLPKVCGIEPTTEQMAGTNVSENEIMPMDKEHGKGTHIGGEFTRTYYCLKKDGPYFNFYVKNNGDVPVLITINGEYDRIIPAGSGGHICAPVTATIFTQSMKIKCVTASSGGTVNIAWEVAQRDIDST